MKQRSTFLKVFMTLMLLLGVSSVWAETKTLIIDGTPLPSTATTNEADYTYGDFTICMSPGAKLMTSTGDNKFTTNAILIGKEGKYIYNKTAIPGKITKFEIYANKGASAKVSVGVIFSKTALTTYATGANTYTATLSTLDKVYDCSSKLPEDAQYFWFQVTNAYNSQVQFRITYEEGNTPSISASNVDLEADATSGEIAYTISNPVQGKTVSASTTADWISDINVGTEKVTFTTTANTGEERTADVTLTYDGATDKVVKVTQKKYVQVYAITLATGIVGGTIEASAAEAAAGSTISLTAHPISGYTLNEWSVKDADNNPITVTANKFTMPASKVTVSATFNEVNYLFYESFNTNEGTGGNDDQWDGNIASNNIASDNVGWTFGNGYGANQCAKFGSGKANGSATTPVINASGCMILTFKAAAWNSDGESTTLNISTTSGTLSESSITLTKGAWTEYKITISGAENPQITFEAVKAANNRFFLDEILITNKAVVTITSAGWATACIPFDATVSGDVTAYYVTVKDGELIQTPIEEDEHIVAETGVLLKSNSGNETNAVFTQVVLNEDKIGEAWCDNMLIGTTIEEGEDFEEPGCTYYILSDGENGVGFYWDGENYDEFEGAGAHCNQYKAVLAVPTGAGAPSFFTFDDATAINGISSVKASGVRYNLNGQAVGEDYKGIVIVNGKKMFNK